MKLHVPHIADSDADAPDFGDYFAILKKRRRLLFSVAAPIAVLAALLALGLPDLYRASGLIEIEVSAQNMKNTVDRDTQEPPYADQYVQTLGTIVLGAASLTRMLQRLQLYEDQSDDPKMALAHLRRDIDVDIVTVPILDPETGREREVVSAFTVAYDNPDPRRAQLGAAWLVDAYLAENRRDRQRHAGGAAKFFAAESERLRTHVAELESRQAEFKRKYAGQLPERTQDNLNVMDRIERDVQDVETQMQALRRERVFLIAQLQQARAMGPESASAQQLEAEYQRKSATYDESHPDLVSLRRQIETLRRGGSVSGMSLQAQLQTQRSILHETRQRYSEDHPDVKRIQRNIEALQARIAAGDTADRSVATDSPMAMQVQTQINATDTQIAALQGRAAELRSKLTQLETSLSSAPQVEREFQVVTRDLTSARQKYDELLRRQMDAEVSEAAIASGTADRFRVTSVPATPNEPAKPQRLAIFVIGLIMAGVAGLSAAIAAQLFDRTVRGVRDLRDLLDVTPLAAVPVIQNSESAGLHRKSLAMATTRTLVVAAIAYYAVRQLLF
jgi:succinoglycan biosynthesis transport protein ExoP